MRENPERLIESTKFLVTKCVTIIMIYVSSFGVMYSGENYVFNAPSSLYIHTREAETYF